jgi:DNA-binding transcriptional ArsR family regulator
MRYLDVKPKRRFKDAAYGQLARIGKALSSPKRLELLDLLCQTERHVESLAEQAAMSVANTSQHLQVLEGARLVEGRKNGRFRCVLARRAQIHHLPLEVRAAKGCANCRLASSRDPYTVSIRELLYLSAHKLLSAQRGACNLSTQTRISFQYQLGVR